jgi:hypothetical protein
LPPLIAGRVLQALGACAGIVLSRAMIRDVDKIGLQSLQAPRPRLLSRQLGIS